MVASGELASGEAIASDDSWCTIASGFAVASDSGPGPPHPDNEIIAQLKAAPKSETCLLFT
jgi:hypothetical protein